jgi:hypothetical protein
MDIPDPPDRPVCAGHGPLKWGWFPTTKQGPRWVSFTVGEGGVLVPHLCDDPERGARWQPDELVAARSHEYSEAIYERFGWTRRNRRFIEGKERHA